MTGARQRRATVASTYAVWLVCLLTAAPDARAQTPSLAWTIASGDVRVTCPLTVGGSFEAKTMSLSGTLTVDPAASPLKGELSVALSTLDTGISLRNEHLRDKYLEIGKGDGFDKAVLSGIDVGSFSKGVAEGSRPFSARLRLHGTEQPVSGRATLSRRGSAVRVEASFPVRLADYGIPDPRYLGVGVGKEVTVRVTFVANPVS